MSWFHALISDGVKSGAAGLFARGNFTDAEKVIINNTFVKLENDQQLQHIFTLKVYGVSSQANAILDWITSAYDATVVGAPTFNAYNGFTGTGNAADYINTNFNPNGIVNQNSVIVQGWDLSDEEAATSLFGAQDGSNEGIVVIPKSATGTVITRHISDGNDSVAQTGRGAGYWTLDRKSSTSYAVYIANTLKSNYAKTSTAVPNLNIYNLASNNNGVASNPGNREIAAFLVASGAGDYDLISDAINDAIVELHALGVA